MTKNDGQTDATVDAPCMGVASAYRITGQRRKKLRWEIKNDPFYPCPGLDPAQVQVRFSSAILAETQSEMATPLDRVNGTTPGGSDSVGRITTFIHASESVAPDQTYMYLFYYQNQKASRDPEVDVGGVCPSCGPD